MNRPVKGGKLPQTFRKKLAKGEVVFGVFCKATTPEWIECLGHAGFDFCILDREHGPASFESLSALVLAAESTGMLPIIRVRNASEEEIGHSLDLGAKGIQVPQVDSAEMASRAVDCAKFAPDGHRGVCRFVRAADFSQKDRADYFREANQSLVILQLEDTKLETYRQFIETKGVDVLFIGPYDLSQRLGLPGQVDHPTVIREIRKLIELAKAKKKSVGIFADTPEQAARWIEAGCQYIAYSVDVGLFSNICRETCNTLNNLRKSK